MTDADFIRAIIAEPDADDHRIVYADYLESRDELARAEFVRVQVELAGIIGRECTCPRPMNLAAQPPQDCPRCLRWASLRRRERELLEGHVYSFIDGLIPGWKVTGLSVGLPLRCDFCQGGRRTGAVELDFTRGFVSSVTLSWADFQTHAKQLLDACPLRRVNRGKACTRCRGGIIPHSDDVPCEYCRGTGTVDDWRGDGVVRLTTWPAIDLVRQTPNGYVQRIRGGRCEVETGYGEPYESAFLKAAAAEYPGVDFGLPAAAGEVRPNDFVRDTLRQQGFSDEQIASWNRLREFTDYAARIAAASPAMTALRTILSSTTGDSP